MGVQDEDQEQLSELHEIIVELEMDKDALVRALKSAAHALRYYADFCIPDDGERMNAHVSAAECDKAIAGTKGE